MRLKEMKLLFQVPMDFQSLSRKDLQILCKKNKIPANMTNVAMADALAALTNVEGIEQVGISHTLLQSPQTCKGGSRRKPIKDPAAEPNTSTTVSRTRGGRSNQHVNPESNPDEIKYGSEVLETPALRTDRKRPTRGASLSRTSHSPTNQQHKDFTQNPNGAEMLKTPATRTATAQRKPTIEPKEKSVVTRAYSTRRSARLIQDPQLSEMSKGRKRTEEEEDKGASVVDSTLVSDVTGKAPSVDKVIVSDEISYHQDSAEVDNIQDSTNFKIELLESNQDKSNKLQGDANAETQICLEGIQVANKPEDVPDLEDIQVASKPEDVPDAEASSDLEDIQVANKPEDVPDAQASPDLENVQVANKPEDVPDLEDIQVANKPDDVPDLEDIQVANKPEDVPDAKASPEVVISVEDLAADNLQENNLENKGSAFRDTKFDQNSSHSEVSYFVEVLGGETNLALDHATPEKTTCSEGQEFVANGEVVVSPDICNNVAEPVPSPIHDASSSKAKISPVGASSEDSKSNQDGSVEAVDSQTEHPTPEKTHHSESQQFVTNGDNIAISAGTPNNEIKLCPDGVSSANVNPVDGAFGATPSYDASCANVVQVFIPEDTSRLVELPGSLVAHSTLKKANNSKDEEYVASASVNQFLIPEASGYLGVANEDIGLFSDASGVDTIRVNCATSADVNQVVCATGNIDVGADTNQVMEQTHHLKGENVESPLEELRDLEVHLGKSFESRDDDVLESAIPGTCKVKSTEVENEKHDNQISSGHSETQGWEAAVDIPSILTQVPGSPQLIASDSKHVLNQNKKASPVTLKVFDEDKEENRSRLNVMSVAEDKAILGSKLVIDENKENTTTSASSGRQNVEKKGMNNISLRKLKKMFKESLVSNKEQMQFEKTRPALQTLTDNCLVEDGNI